MKKKDIESFLRENKPQVSENPTFLLEVQQKMRSMEGIKTEMDRQRRHGRRAFVTALLLGLISGVVITILAYLYPVDPESISKGIVSSVRIFIDTWKQYLLFTVAALAIALGVIAPRYYGSGQPR